MENFIDATIIYLLIGIALSEVATWVERRHGKATAAAQYVNLVFLWPIVVYVAYTRK